MAHRQLFEARRARLKYGVVRSIVPYWVLRNLVYTLASWFHIQCTGKRRTGLALEWCQLSVGHDGPCINRLGQEFTA